MTFQPGSRIAIIGNPASGRGRGQASLAAVEQGLRARGFQPELLPTRSAGHAVELAREAALRAPALVVAVGGDGTLRDVSEGLLAARQTAPTHLPVPLALVPSGTGNDFARTLGIPRVPDAALNTALEGATRELDAWLWNGTPFLNVAGLGLDAAVGKEVNESHHKLRGTLAYVAALFTVLRHYQPFELSLQWEGGEWSGRAWLAAFGNGKCYGGGMQIAPAAVPDDGLLDLVVVEDVPKLELIRQLPGLFSGKHVRHPRVRTFRVARVSVSAPPQPVTLDGELIASPPAEIVLSPYRLPVRVPKR